MSTLTVHLIDAQNEIEHEFGPIDGRNTRAHYAHAIARIIWHVEPTFYGRIFDVGAPCGENATTGKFDAPVDEKAFDAVLAAIVAEWAPDIAHELSTFVA